MAGHGHTRFMSSRSNICAEIEDYANNCFASETSPRVGECASLLGVSRDTLSAWFHQAGGETLTKYLHKLQISRAKQLLMETSDTLARIAQRSGYGHERTLARAFYRLTGVTPGQYRTTVRAGKGDRGSDRWGGSTSE